MLVLFHHHFSFLRVSRFAWIGVDLFFVLSGYLVTTGLLNTKNDRGSIFSFYVKRILRIFPLYYLVLAISFLIFKAFPKNGYSYFIHNQAYFWTYTQNWLWAFTGMPPNSMFNHLWSLAIEEQFYICWPLLICYNKPRAAMLSCIGLILLSILLRNTVNDHYFSYFSTFTRIDGLAVGSLLALLFRHGSTPYTMVYMGQCRRFFCRSRLDMLFGGFLRYR